MERLTGNVMVTVLCIALVGLGGMVQAGILYVDSAADAGGSGSSWTEAFACLQDALAVAQAGDEIRVAQGLYRPDCGSGITPGDKGRTFSLVTGTTLAGGYAGIGGVDPDERDIERYKTILSGDLNGDDGPYFANIYDNSIVVVSSLSNDARTILEGVTVTGGWGPTGPGITALASDLCIRRCIIAANKTRGTSGHGAGVYSFGGSPVMQECVFRDNFAWGDGGGCWSRDGDLTCTDCVFEGNRAIRSGGGLSLSNGLLTLEGCTFRSNEGYWGGGMYAYVKDGSTCADCLFTDNVATHATQNTSSGGGAEIIGTGSTTFLACRFEGNSAADGGGMSGRGVSLIDCLFEGNWAQDNGGGIDSSDDVTLLRCVFNENTAGAGGAWYRGYGTASATDCAFTGNTADETGGGAVYVHHGTRGRSTPSQSIASNSTAFIQCRFSGNTAQNNSGGALYNTNNGTALTNCLLVGNTGDDGGAIFNRGAKLGLSNCTLAQNRGDLAGGLLDDANGTVLKHCIVWNNEGEQIVGDVVATYSDIAGGWPGAGNIDVDPVFASPGYWEPIDARIQSWIGGDYHLQSQAGRWDPNAETWALDEVTSPCIDAGDPGVSLGDEPQPNGSIINLGAYGGTAEASKSFQYPALRMN